MRQPVAYDGFDYPAGSELHGKSGGSGWGGAWQNVRSIEWHKAFVEQPGATYGALVACGGKAVVDNTTAHHYRALPSALGAAGDTIWMSFIMGDSDIGDEGSWNAFAPIYSAYGYSSDPKSFDNRLFGVQIDGNGSQRKFRIKKHWANNTWISPNWDHYGWGSIPWTPADHFVVVRITMSQQVSNVRAWIDPADVHNLGSAQLGLDGNNNGPVQFDGVRWHAEPFHDSHTARLDEVRIGTSLESVTPGL